MEDRLQSLTDKIYQEGVEKGHEEARKIIAEAQSKADNLISDANKESEKIIEQAKKEAEELKKNSQAELTLSGKQALSALKQEMINVVSDELIKSSVKPVTKDTEFVKTLIKTALEKGNSEGDVTLYISESSKKEIETFLEKNMKGLLNKGLKLETINGIKAGFQIGPSDGSYKLSFTDEDFEAFFKDLLRPGIVKFLFA